MDLDPRAWVVHRHVVDPRLDELDPVTAAPGAAAGRPRTSLDTGPSSRLEELNLLAATDEAHRCG